LFFATIAVVVFGVVAIAAPRTAVQIDGSARWGLLFRVAIAIWLLPLAWWAWTIATTGTIRSRNFVELWWLSSRRSRSHPLAGRRMSRRTRCRVRRLRSNVERS